MWFFVFSDSLLFVYCTDWFTLKRSASRTTISSSSSRLPLYSSETVTASSSNLVRRVSSGSLERMQAVALSEESRSDVENNKKPTHGVKMAGKELLGDYSDEDNFATGADRDDSTGKGKNKL